jgi:serine/threonine protein kinase
MIKKTNMSAKDIQFQRTEIDMLRMCQHPNIIKLLDAYESLDYIYIILEHMEGGDLFDFLEIRNHYTDE